MITVGGDASFAGQNLCSQAGTERAVVDRVTNLQQEIGAASRPTHLRRLIHLPIHQEIGGPFRDRGSDPQTGAVALDEVNWPATLPSEVTIQSLQGGPESSLRCGRLSVS